MKVLFAVNNDNISDAIIKKYQKEYKEILSYKNVYYFNAILKELQKDKTYDRVVISEDLEPFANSNYDTIDKFLFEKLDNISDEAEGIDGNSTDIILISTDRRTKSDDMLLKLFSIGVYNALVGQDRSIDEVCKLINKPRAKKEAKQYYKIEAESASYQAENENNVSEAEVQNILAHYKRLGKNEDKYVDSFNNIVSQYTDAQLKIIIRYLPINVKAVLEEKSNKYQELVTFSVKDNKEKSTQINQKSNNENENKTTELLNKKFGKINITKPIVIPSGLNTNQVKRLIREKTPEEMLLNKNDLETEEIEDEEIQEFENPIKKGRGRPRKNISIDEELEDKPKRGRGRPKKYQETEEIEDEEEPEELVNLFDLNEEEKSEEEVVKPEEKTEELMNLFSLDETEEKEEPIIETKNATEEIVQTQYNQSETVLNTLITKDKKIVTFVGTTKNGTSFIVNNLGELLSSMGISTAILDMTKSKNAYYIYTKNEENLRKTSENSIYKLKSGIAEGIKANKNLTIYTDVPGEEKDYSDAENILSTLIKNYNVVLIDCDFDTPTEYFAKAQEIYLVQSMDVLTIQPLTGFLRNLKSKNILKQDKIKIIINKEQKLRSLQPKTLIGGMAFYNDPAMSFMTELFNKDTVPYCTIPFEMQNYAKYLNSLVNCEISLNGYTKTFMSSLKELSNMVYPLINKPTYTPRGDKYKDNFTTEMNDTLNKMKNNY